MTDFIDFGDNPVNGPLRDKGGAVFNVKHKDFGAKGDGTTDDTVAIQAAVTVASVVGGVVYFPTGSYVVTDTITNAADGVFLRGAGRKATYVYFKPSVTGKSCFKFANGASAMFNLGLSDMTVIAHATAASLQKTAVELVDCCETTIREFQVADFSGSNGGAVDANGMLATPSTGFLIKGREIAKIENIIVEADAPIWIRDNPNDSPFQLNADHMRADGLYSLCTDTAGAHIRVDANVILTTTTFGGHQAWVGGKYGLYKNDGGGAASRSYQVNVKNVRFEQTTAGGYLCYWVSNVAQLQFENCYPGTSNGFYVRYCQSLVLIGNVTSNTSGVNFDIDSTVVACQGLGNDWADSSTVSLGTNVTHLQSSKSSVKTLGASFWIGAASPFTALQLVSSLITTPTLAGLVKMSDAIAAIRSGATSWGVKDSTEAFFNLQVDNATGATAARARLTSAAVTVTYAATMNPNAQLGNVFTITATNNTAFTISTPSNAAAGQRIRIRIRNASGGALGVASWGAVYKMGAAWTQPANGFSRSIDFDYDGTNWVEANRSPADVAN